MREVISKFVIDCLAGVHTIPMPAGAEILSAGVQMNKICIWAKCNPSLDFTRRIIEIYHTDERLPPANRKFLGTVQVQSYYPFHIFERDV